MEYEYVSVQDFKKLEEKVNKLLLIHELDSILSKEEKQLLEEAKDDMKNKRNEKFVSVDEL